MQGIRSLSRARKGPLFRLSSRPLARLTAACLSRAAMLWCTFSYRSDSPAIRPVRSRVCVSGRWFL